MILNNIDKVYIGANEADELRLGTYVVWEGGEPVVVYEVIATDITSYQGTAPKVYVLDVDKWYMRTVGGNYTEYGQYAEGKPQDPYVGQLAVEDDHEWEYTASGWVDLGSTQGSIKHEYFLGQKNSVDYEYKLGHYWDNDYKMVVDFYLTGSYSSDVGGLLKNYNGESLFEINLYNNGYYLDWHAPNSTSSPTVNTSDYDERDMHSSISQIPKDSTRLLLEIKAKTSVKVYNYDTGVLLYSAGTLNNNFNYCTTGKYQIGIRRNGSSNTSFIHAVKIYNNNDVLQNDFEVKYRGGDGSNKFYVQDNVDNTVYENLGSSNTFSYDVIETGIIVYPKEYTEMSAPEPISYGYQTSASEYLKVSDNYYKKDYVTEIYSGGTTVVTSQYVQGEQLTPTYVQGEASDFIIYDGGRYYKNYIYVTPVDTPIATGDYVRGDYIGAADIIISGLTSKSQDFTLRINGTPNSKTATITGTQGSYHTYAWYDDLSQSYSLAYMSYNGSYVNYLKSIHINPDAKITSIQSIAEQMSYLENITLPSGLTAIQSLAFSYATGLKSLYIPAAVTSIQDFQGSPFKQLNSLTDFAVDPNNANFKSETQCLLNKAGTQLIRAFKGYVIPSSVTEIYNQAFNNNGYVTDVVIPDAVTTIPSFRECSALSSVKLSDNSTTMNGWTFVDIPKLSSITLPSGLTSIGDNNFYMTNSTYGRGYEITIPATVTSIGNNCFQKQNCVVHMQSSTPPTLGSSCFTNNYGYIYVPVGSRETYIAASNWSALADRIVEEGETFATAPVTGTSTGGTVTIGFASKQTAYITGVDGDYQTFAIPTLTATTMSYGNSETTNNIVTLDLSRATSLTSLGNYALGSKSLLKSILLPDTITAINGRAFDSCSALTSVTIPSGVTSIGEGAFYKCFMCVIHVESETPCNLSTDALGAYNNGIIYVPVGTAATYKGATNWSSYSSRIYEEGTTFNFTITGKTSSGGSSTQFYYRDVNNTDHIEKGVVYSEGLIGLTPTTGVDCIGGGNSEQNIGALFRTIDLTNTTPTKVASIMTNPNNKLEGIAFPSSITTFISPPFTNINNVVKWVILKATTPPPVQYGRVADYIKGTLYVPDESVNAYKTASKWNAMADRIKPMSDFATDFPNE